MTYAERWSTVRVDLDPEGIAWVELNRPDKRNAMNPTLNAEMIEVLEALDADDACLVVVLTGAGEAFSAGMDLKEYFRDVDGSPAHVQRRVRRDSAQWQWRLLRTYAKPTIAMVNGWCFGGAFTPLVACDLAIAADEATFGLSEVNWGIPPGGVVSRALAETVGTRAALLHIMTGRTFDGPRAAEMGLVNASVPRAQLRDETRALAADLAGKNPVVLRAAKLGFKHCRDMSWDEAEDYLYAKLEQSQFLDAERGREQGMQQFLDEKRIKPGLQAYERYVSSVTSPAFRVATVADGDAVTAAMATAFETDPVWGAYSFPDPARREQQSERFWAYCISTALRFPNTFVTPGCEAAAVWIPPGEPEMTPAQEAGLAALLTEMLGAGQAGTVMDAFALLDAAHPHDEPHHYLSLLATHRAHRGRGLGMALLGMCLEQIDRAHLPAYLESTNPANDARYMRYGFRPHTRLELPNGAPVTTMWRDTR